MATATTIPNMNPEAALVPLSGGQVCIVDFEDYEYVSKFKWYSSWDKCTQSFYAKRAVVIEGKRTSETMHRVLLGLRRGDRRKADHINGNTLDNRRRNLRPANNSENARNCRKPAHNTSGLKGVSPYKAGGNFTAQIRVDGKKIHLGYFPTADLAHAAYVDAAKRYHGDFARTS